MCRGGYAVEVAASYELLLVDEEDGGVCFEVHAFGAAHDFEASCADIALVGESQPDDVQHVYCEFTYR